MDGVLIIRLAVLAFIILLFITLCVGGLIDRDAPELQPAGQAESF